MSINYKVLDLYYYKNILVFLNFFLWKVERVPIKWCEHCKYMFTHTYVTVFTLVLRL